jgi:hypothetical protein
MIGSQFEREDRVTEVMPVNYQLSMPEETHSRRHGKSRDRRRVLSVLGFSIDANCRIEIYTTWGAAPLT